MYYTKYKSSSYVVKFGDDAVLLIFMIFKLFFRDSRCSLGLSCIFYFRK
jgi:hypothetical protein